MTPPDPKVYRAIERWMQVRALEGRPVMPASFAIDAMHSARGGLLRRLYDGKEPLQAPPPLAFSAPWYELMEAGAAGITGEMEVSMWGRPLTVDIVINQCAWHLVEQKGEHDFVVEYRGRMLAPTRWPAYRCTLVRQKTGAEFFNTWHLRPHAQEGAHET